MTEKYDSYLEMDARLVILRELAKQVDGRLNEVVITRTLDEFGHRRSRDWVRSQMQYLEKLKAVKLVASGSVLVAAITRAGMDHVERRIVIKDILRPSPED